MSHFIELTENEMYVIDGGDFWKTVEYIGGAAGAFGLSKACGAVLGAVTMATPAGAVAAVIIGCVGFAAVGTGLAGAAIVEATS